MKGWKKLYHASTIKRKMMSDKLDFKARSIITDNKGHFIIKGPIHQEFKLSWWCIYPIMEHQNIKHSRLGNFNMLLLIVVKRSKQTKITVNI